jgi:hypothetical protein
MSSNNQPPGPRARPDPRESFDVLTRDLPPVRLHIRRHRQADIVSASFGISVAEQALRPQISPRRIRQARLIWPGDQDRLAFEVCHFVGDARPTHLARRIALFMPTPDQAFVQAIGQQTLTERIRRQPAVAPRLGTHEQVARPKVKQVASTEVPMQARQLLALGPDEKGLVVPLLEATLTRQRKEVDWVDWVRMRQDRLTEPTLLCSLLKAWRVSDAECATEPPQARSLALVRVVNWAHSIDPWLKPDARLATALVLETMLRMAMHCAEVGAHKVMPASTADSTADSTTNSTGEQP